MPSFKKKNNKWSVVFDLPTETDKRYQKRLSGYASRREAELAYMAFSSTYRVVKPQTLLTFENIYNSFIEYKTMQNKSSSIVDMQTCFNKFILPYFDDKDINGITASDIAEWQITLSRIIGARNKPLTAKYKNKVMGYLSALFKYAIIHYDAHSNPCDKVQKFRSQEKKQEMLIFTPEQFSEFISNVHDTVYNTFFNLLYYSGLRPGEAIALKWNDLQGDCIRVDETITRKLMEEERAQGLTWKLTTTKNTSSYRFVTLPNKLIKSLSELKTHYKQYIDFKEDNFVFGGIFPMSDSSIGRIKKEACLLANLPIIRNHDFRHSHASLLISMGFDILSIAKRLGHADIKQTLNTYGHIMPNKQSEMALKLNEI